MDNSEYGEYKDKLVVEVFLKKRLYTLSCPIPYGFQVKGK